MITSIQPKKTKIIATIGPASRNIKILADMIDQGLNIIRMNFSHGSHDDHAKTIEIIRKVEKNKKQALPLLQDLSGPKIRLGKVVEGTEIKKDDELILTTEQCLGDNKRVYINYKKLPKEIAVGSVIKIDDGKKELIVTKIHNKDIVCSVVVGGTLSSHKGVNLPGTQLSIPALTAKDKKDVAFGIQHKVDFIALSFVQRARDITALKNLLVKQGSNARIIAKIETVAAVENIDEIIDVSDGIMVARGDLAVEIGVEKVPLVQKKIIRKCNERGKPVITATQMLDSMEKNPVPTRAEVSDVANAILDGTDAIMLSGESAVGNYPVESIKTMSAIAKRTEGHYKNTFLEYVEESRDVVDTMSVSAVRIANNIRARILVCLTESGLTARMIARFRPHHGVIAITPHQDAFRQLEMLYGCKPIHSNMGGSITEVTKEIQALVKKHRWALPGEKIVVTAGTPFGKIGSTNTIFVVDAK